MGNKSFKSNSTERVQILDPENEGESPIYRSALVGENLITTYDENVHTLYDAMMRSVKDHGDNDCLGRRVDDGDFEFISYSVAWERGINFGAGLVDLGSVPGESKIGIYMNNCVEWMLTDFGCLNYGLTVVPLYDTLGPDACTYILSQAEIDTVVCTSNHTQDLLEGDTPSLKNIIQIGEIDADVLAAAEAKGINVVSFETIEANGRENPVDVHPPSANDTATICYTSGTTGDPKGVILTHGNFIALLGGIRIQGVRINSDDVHISYLPLAHVFERLVMSAVLSEGACAGFYRGNVLQLMDDIQALRPTVFPSVPRLFNRIYDKVLAKARQGGLSETIFNTALESKLDNLKTGYHGHSIWDSLVFGKISAQLGGRVRLMMTGSAPISEDVISFLRVSMSCPVLEGYGQTESCGASTVTLLGDTQPGHVGVPLGCCDVKLVDVPDMNYLHTDPNPRGEVCFRGPSCSPGYYKNAEKTAELIDSDGWTHSGDIGEWLPSGSLKIIDRKKNIFKLSQGEYVAPEKLENIFATSQYVAQMFVYGDSLKSKLVAIVVPDEEIARGWATENGMPEDISFDEIASNEDFINTVRESINLQGEQNDVRGFERIADFRISTELFSVDNDLLTPTFKLKRPQARDYYQAQLDDMYENID